MSGRITVLLATYSNSGVPRIRLTLTRILASRGFNVDLVLVGGTLPEAERIKFSDSVNVVELRKSRVAAALPSLVKYFRRARPSGIIAAESHINVIAMVALRLSCVSAPITVSFHVPPDRDSSKPLWHKARWNSLIGHWVFPRAAAIVAISSGMADSLARSLRLPITSIRVIHNPVVHSGLFDKASREMEPAIDTGAGFILGVGRLSPNKGFIELIDAFALIRDDTKLNLVILGEGVDRSRLEERVRKLSLGNRVFLPGAVNNPYSWMANAKLFVSSSHFEGLSNVIIEALACGCPVVATDCFTGPKEILKNGRYGELVPVGDSTAMAKAIQRALEKKHDRQALKKRAMDFHADGIIDQYLEVLGLPKKPHKPANTRVGSRGR